MFPCFLTGSTVGSYDGNSDPDSSQRISNVSCTGSESRLIDCPHNIVQNNTESNELELQCQTRKLIMCEHCVNIHLCIILCV